MNAKYEKTITNWVKKFEKKLKDYMNHLQSQKNPAFSLNFIPEPAQVVSMIYNFEHNLQIESCTFDITIPLTYNLFMPNTDVVKKYTISIEFPKTLGFPDYYMPKLIFQAEVKDPHGYHSEILAPAKKESSNPPSPSSREVGLLVDNQNLVFIPLNLYPSTIKEIAGSEETDNISDIINKVLHEQPSSDLLFYLNFAPNFISSSLERLKSFFWYNLRNPKQSFFRLQEEKSHLVKNIFLPLKCEKFNHSNLTITLTSWMSEEAWCPFEVFYIEIWQGLYDQFAYFDLEGKLITGPKMKLGSMQDLMMSEAHIILKRIRSKFDIICQGAGDYLGDPASPIQEIWDRVHPSVDAWGLPQKSYVRSPALFDFCYKLRKKTMTHNIISFWVEMDKYAGDVSYNAWYPNQNKKLFAYTATVREALLFYLTLRGSLEFQLALSNIYQSKAIYTIAQADINQILSALEANLSLPPSIQYKEIDKDRLSDWDPILEAFIKCLGGWMIKLCFSFSFVSEKPMEESDWIEGGGKRQNFYSHTVEDHPLDENQEITQISILKDLFNQKDEYLIEDLRIKMNLTKAQLVLLIVRSKKETGLKIVGDKAIKS